MVKQSTHCTELEHLFRLARKDVPSADVQRQMQASVLSVLRSGNVPVGVLAETQLGNVSTASSFIGKILLSVGAIAIVTTGVTYLLHRPLEALQPVVVTSALTPSVPTVSIASSSDAVEQNAAPLPSIAVASSVVRIKAEKVLPSEASVIEQAHRQLSSNPERALALTEFHRKLYPKGILAQEREVIAIEALARLGKAQAAEKRVDDFRVKEPNSIHQLRLRGVLGDASVESQP